MYLEKKFILFIIPTLRGGGAERIIVNLVKHLNRDRFRLMLVVVDMTEAVYQEEIPDDVELINLGATRVRYAIQKIIRLIWQYKPNIIFSTLGHLNLALAIIRGLLPPNIRIIARETTIVSQAIKSYYAQQIWKVLYYWFYPNHDLLVFQSRHMQKDLVENFNFPQDKSIVINNPVDVDHIRLLATFPVKYPWVKTNSIKLIAAGRLNKVKGFDILIEALARLKNPFLHLTLLGEGPLEYELKQLAKEKGVAKQIYFAGFQSNPYAWFAQADAFILSSRFEGFPNAMLEALTCGTPVIATPALGGTLEILENIPECIIAESIDARSLANAITQWLKSERKRVSLNAVSPYRVEKIIAEYEQILMQK